MNDNYAVIYRVDGLTKEQAEKLNNAFAALIKADPSITEYSHKMGPAATREPIYLDHNDRMKTRLKWIEETN